MINKELWTKLSAGVNDWRSFELWVRATEKFLSDTCRVYGRKAWAELLEESYAVEDEILERVSVGMKCYTKRTKYARMLERVHGYYGCSHE